jgi:hypothetical protein
MSDRHYRELIDADRNLLECVPKMSVHQWTKLRSAIADFARKRTREANNHAQAEVFRSYASGLEEGLKQQEVNDVEASGR